LKKRNRWLASLWRVGDAGYYLGLLLAIICPLGVLTSCFLQWWRDEARVSFGRVLLAAAIGFFAFAGVFLLSATLKAYVRKKGGVESVY
jgi:hypothetical protein